MSTVPSVEALSMMTTSRLGYFCSRTESRQRLMNRPLLYVTSVTETRSLSDDRIVLYCTRLSSGTDAFTKLRILTQITFQYARTDCRLRS